MVDDADTLDFSRSVWVILAVLAGVVAAWFAGVYFVGNLSTESALRGEPPQTLSSFFSGLAFAGVLIALFLQQRQILLQQREIRLQRVEFARNFAAQLRVLHNELQRMSIEDPDLATVWGSQDYTAFRKEAFVNLILSNWEMQFEQGLMTKDQISTLLTRYFASVPFQTFWRNARAHRQNMALTPAAKQFHSFAERAFNSATSVPSPG